MTSPTPRPRIVVCLAMILYCAGIIAVALQPLAEADWAVVVVVAVSGIAIIGLVAHMAASIRLPGEDYAYLVCGYAGLTALLLYLADSPDPGLRKVAVGLLLGCGVIGGYGAFLAQAEIDQDL